MTQWDSFVGHKDDLVYKNLSYTIVIEWRGKTHIIILIDVQKIFDKIQHLFMTKYSTNEE